MGGRMPSCSFCGKSQDAVAKLIAGPQVFICNECVRRCAAVLDDGAPDAAPTFAQLANAAAAAFLQRTPHERHDVDFLTWCRCKLASGEALREPPIDLVEYEVKRETLAMLPGAICERLCVLPVSLADGAIVVAMADPTAREAIDEIVSLTGRAVDPVVAAEPEIRAAIARYYYPS